MILEFMINKSRGRMNMVQRDLQKQAIDVLNEPELKELAEFMAFLKFRGHFDSSRIFDPSICGKLYADFAAEDLSLAEEGIEEYRDDLSRENGK
jgi:hypothetical protein